VLGLDGADHALVSELVARGRLPTIGRLAREGTFGPLRSTIPAVTPTAWSSFLTGLNPGAHGIFNFSTNPNRAVRRLESAASRGGAPLWRALGAAGIRSAFVTVPFTYPPEPVEGILVTGYGGPARPEILPSAARERIFAEHPDLVTAHHPMQERWWEDFGRYASLLRRHVEEIGEVSRLALELEPDLGLLCVDFMSTDHAGHLGYHRLDPSHPAHDPAEAGEELVEILEATDRVCGELAEAAAALYGEEPTLLCMSDHGMKPIHWTFHLNRWLEEQGLLRYRRRSLQPLRGGRLDALHKVDSRLARRTGWWTPAVDVLPLAPRSGPDRAFADIDFTRTRAYAFATGGQLFLGERTGARTDPRFEDELAGALEAIPHPETGEPAFRAVRKRDLYHGPYVDKGPELLVLPHDERIHVDGNRRPWTQAWDRHDRLDPEIGYGYSGHHGLNGILAAAGPGIRPADLPEGAEITQLAATILRLFGLAAEGLDGRPLEEILEPSSADAETVVAGRGGASEQPVYSEEEERRIVERLRDLGYE